MAAETYLTCRQAFCIRYPSIVQPSEISLLQNKQQNHSQFGDEYSTIPSSSYLCEWKNDIEQYQKDNPGEAAFAECKARKKVLYNLQIISDLLKIHRACDVSKEVQRELDWYAEMVDWPADVEEYPQQESITHFQNLLYSSRIHAVLPDYDMPFDVEEYPQQESITHFQNLLYSSRIHAVLPDYDMPVDELSKLCCTRWLSSDHICWMTEMLNKAQGETYCVFMNYVGNVKRFVTQRIAPLQPKPSKYLFILNVGRDRGSVYLGSDLKPGNHWTVCYVDTNRRIITYGDSIAWERPEILVEKIAEYVHEIKDENIALYSFVYAHDPLALGSSGHHCGSKCASLYPLQRCSNVCGVVALVVAAIACLAPNHFNELINQGIGRRCTHMSFLKDPTKYSKYLRFVLMSWFAEKRINVSHVLPKPSLLPPVNAPAVKQDEPDVPHSLRVPCDQSSTEKTSNQPREPNHDFIPEDQDQKPSDPSNLNKNKCKNVGGKFEYPHCHLICRDKFNLRRHMKRKHQTKQGETGAENNLDPISLSSENCRCCHCEYRCRRIVELRKHLSECHNIIFRTETFTFERYTG